MQPYRYTERIINRLNLRFEIDDVPEPAEPDIEGDPMRALAMSSAAADQHARLCGRVSRTTLQTGESSRSSMCCLIFFHPVETLPPWAGSVERSTTTTAPTFANYSMMHDRPTGSQRTADPSFCVHPPRRPPATSARWLTSV